MSSFTKNRSFKDTTMDNLSKHNRALLQNYQYHLKVEKGLSENSIKSYQLDICNLLSEIDKDIESITNKDIIDFFVTLQELGLTNSSIARKRSSIRSFLKFLIEEEMQISAVVDDIPRIKPSKRLPDVLSVKLMFKLLDNIPIKKPTDLRNKAMLELMYATGIRISETIDLSIHNIFWDEEVIRVLGKGGKQRVVPVAGTSMNYLKKYCNSARALLRRDNNIDIVFLNRFGNKLSRMGVWKVIDKLADSAGISKHISPHTFRHSFATHLLEAGANLRVVQMLLGHSSINTTQIYINIDNSFIRQEHRLHHPRC